MVKNAPFVNHGACLYVMNESLQSCMAAYQCDHSHQHEPAVGSHAKQTGFYTRQFASLIVEAWYPQKWFQHVPDLSTSSTLVTLNPTKSQWSKDEKAIKAIKAEAEGLRANGTWDDSTVIPVAELRKRARAKGEDINIAEVLQQIFTLRYCETSSQLTEIITPAECQQALEQLCLRPR